MAWSCVSRICKSQDNLRMATKLPHDSNLAGDALRCVLPLLAAAALPAWAADPADPTKDHSPLTWSFSLISEAAGHHFHDGSAAESEWNHLARLGVGLDGAALGLPEGSQFQATLQRTESDNVTSLRTGDAQGVSNIEAASRNRIWELWYSQRIGEPWEVRAGVIPADSYFGAIDNGGLLINSSFGAEAIWSHNAVAPIFPTAGVGAMATWNKDAWTSRTGVFQADPNDRSSALKRGPMLMEEVAYQGTGTYKFGVWSYQPHGSDTLPAATWGAYVIAEHPLASGDGAPTAFLRLGVSPKGVGSVANDLEAGILVPGPFRSRPQDQFSAGVARADLRGLGTETAYEATYQFVVSPHLSLQPDLQYVNNPGGGGNLPAATVAMLRLALTF